MKLHFLDFVIHVVPNAGKKGDVSALKPATILDIGDEWANEVTLFLIYGEALRIVRGHHESTLGEPALTILHETGLIAVGLNKRVVGIDPRVGQIAFVKQLAWYFSRFVQIQGNPNLFIDCEVGIDCISPTGETPWEWKALDSIAGLGVEDETLMVETDDRQRFCLDPGSGIAKAR